MKILLIESNRQLRETLAAALIAELGANVFECSSVTEAQQATRGEPCDVLVTAAGPRLADPWIMSDAGTWIALEELVRTRHRDPLRFNVVRYGEPLDVGWVIRSVAELTAPIPICP